nr:uncharacterized protein LOC109400222 [Aedes albopictus]
MISERSKVPVRTLQNINEPGAGTRLLYGARPLEKKARLSRSLTLPLFNFPGTNAFVGRLQQQPQPLEAFKTSSNNFLYEAKMAASSTTPVSGNSPKILLTTDDTSFDYRRKSSGGSLFTPSGGAPSVAPAEPHIYDFDEKRSSGDGSVVISITSPTAYQIPTSKSLGLNSVNFVNLQNVANTAPSNFNTGNSSLIGSGNSSFISSSIKRGSDVTAYGSSASAQLISNSTNNAIYRLARIINQTTKTPTSPGVASAGPPGSGLLPQQTNDDSARRLSWERRDKDSKRIPRSSSIDSMVDAVWSEFPSSGPGSARNSVSNQSAQSQSTSNVPSSLNIFLSSNRRESMLSPSSNRRSKHQRGISASKEQTIPPRELRPASSEPSPIQKPIHQSNPPEWIDLRPFILITHEDDDGDDDVDNEDRNNQSSSEYPEGHFHVLCAVLALSLLLRWLPVLLDWERCHPPRLIIISVTKANHLSSST